MNESGNYPINSTEHPLSEQQKLHSPNNASDGYSSTETDGLWSGDTGTLEFNARRALLQLVRGPSLTADRHQELWQALLNNRRALEARLSDLFLELIVDEELGVAFIRNAPADDPNTPKSVRNQPLTLIDTIMVLTLRRELLTAGFDRAFIDRTELFSQLSQYRPLAKLDDAAFLKRLEGSWNKLDAAGILQKSAEEDRYEISPVLKLIFGADEVRAVVEEFERLSQEAEQENNQTSSPLANLTSEEIEPDNSYNKEGKQTHVN